MASFGYEADTFFLTEITPPAQIGQKSLTIKANVSWLECKESCFPGKANLEKVVPVSAPSQLDASLAKVFAQARFDLPLNESSWKVSAFDEGDKYSFSVIPPAPGFSISKLSFFPEEQSLIENASPQILSKTKDGWRLDVTKSVTSNKKISEIAGVLSMDPGWRGAGSERGWTIRPSLEAGNAPLPVRYGQSSLLVALLLAFVGGLILNVMPCVLPILSIKVLGLAKQSETSPAERRAQAFFYGLGVLITFWILAGAIFALKAGGHRLGWGFQLQSPVFVSVLIFLFFILTLNLFGVFEIGTSLIGVNVASTRGHLFLEPLSSGILAAVVATPCTAPFMGAALGFALSSPPIQGLAVFTALGGGMALPFMLLMVRPKGLSLLPKPGPWMDKLKKIMGLLLLATTAWLISVLYIQAPGRLIPLMGAFVPLGIAAWFYGKINPLTPAPRRRHLYQATGALFLLAMGVAFWNPKTEAGKLSVSAEGWEPYSQARVEALQAEGRPVFIDFTASWCLTCQVNQRVALDREEVKAAFQQKNVGLLLADWTNQDDAIAKALEQYGRSGVPTYVLLPSDTSKPFRVLPEVLTPSIVLEALQSL